MNKSPNFTVGTIPKIGYIIHGTLGSYAGAVEWLCTPPEKRPTLTYSSAHYVIAKDGRVAQLIADKDVAWHAGNVSYPSERAMTLLPIKLGKYLNPNESFIGIELEWFMGDKVTEEQFKAITTIIKNGGIVNPKLLCHKEVTSYKSDFQTADGRIDHSIVLEINKRITTVATTVVPSFVVDKITPLLTKLNSQLQLKNYKEAKDTTSFLFSELVNKLKA